MFSRLRILYPSILVMFLLAACTSQQKPTPQATPTAPIPTPVPTITLTSLEVQLNPGMDLSIYPKHQPLRLIFNQPMLPESLLIPLNTFPKIYGKYSWNPDNTILTFEPNDELREGSYYQIEVDKRLLSVSGQTYEIPPAWTIYIPPPPDVILPKDVVLDNDHARIQLRFISEMDQQSVGSALKIEPAIPYTLTWSGLALEIEYAPVFTPVQEITMTLGEGMVDKVGQKLDKITWHYTTAPVQALFEPGNVKSIKPSFSLHFNYPIDPDQVGSALRITPAIEYSLDWDESRRTARVNPLQALDLGTLYTVELGMQAGDTSGARLAQAQTWTYQNPFLVDSFKRNPGEGRLAPWVFVFNYKVDPQSFTRSVRISPEVAYHVDWDPGQTVFSVRPDQPLPSQTSFAIWFTDHLFDADGNALLAPEPFQDITPSPVIRFEPKSGYEGSDPRTNIELTFDREMDPQSTVQSLSIQPPTEGSYVWDGPTQLVFHPAERLEEYTTYTVTLTSSVEDAGQNLVMTQPASWTFTTGSLPNLASFGESGANVQVVSKIGRRAVQFVLSEPNIDQLHFELYRISIDQFIKLNKDPFSQYWRREHRQYSTQGAILAASWDSRLGYAMGMESYRTVSEVILPEEVPEGLYILNLVSDHLDDQLLIAYTSSTVTVKYSPEPEGGGSILAWVTNLNDYVMPETKISVYDRAGRIITTGVTDGSGVYQGRIPVGKDPELVVARRDGGISISGVSGIWYTRASYSPSRSPAYFFTYLYTDRPIYRPGQTVYFKGIIRNDDDAVYSLPATGQSLQMSIRDARDNLVYSETLKTSEYGTVQGEFQLAQGATLGKYTLETVLGKEIHRQVFKVQDYAKPDYEIKLTSDRQKYLSGEEVNLDIDVHYLYGKPVANSAVTVNWYPLVWAYDYYGYTPLDSGDEYYWGERTNGYSLTTDAAGHASLNSPTPRPEYEQSSDSNLWGIEVIADDGSSQEVRTFTIIRVYQAAYTLDIDPGGFLYQPGMPFTLRVTLNSHFNDPVEGVPINIVVQREHWSSGESQTGVIASYESTTGASGIVTQTLQLEDEGQYQLEASTRDRAGNTVNKLVGVYVHDFRGTWVNDYSTQLSIRAEKDTYLPGETAHLLIDSSIKGQALLTVERGRVRRREVISLTPPATLIPLPIQREDSPNIYVTVQAWEAQNTDLTTKEFAYEMIPDSLLRIDRVMLQVTPDGKQELQVKVASNQESYAPRETATFTMTVTSADGSPARAELSLALVDEAIYQLSDDLSGPIYPAFYTRPRYLNVQTSDSMSPWRELWMGERGGGGGGGLTAAPRRDFPDTAYWLPAVETDSQGRAVVQVPLPDNLTTWRLTVRAVTRDTKVGESIARVLTHQPLVVRPIFPRSLVSDDRFTLTAWVYNYSPAQQVVEVLARSEGLRFDQPAPQKVTLAAGESKVVQWEVTAGEAGETKLLVTAIAAGYSDAVETSLSVQPRVTRDFNYLGGSFSGEVTIPITVSENTHPLSQVQVEVSSSPAGVIIGGLEYLTDYPYGCVEQVMSSVLPNAVVARAFRELGYSERLASTHLDSKVKAGLQILYGFQQEDGGWGWWFDDVSDPYMTAYVLFGLAQTRRAGYLVDEAVIRRGADWLKNHLDEMDPRLRVDALYSLAIAGYGDAAGTVHQVSLLETMDGVSQSMLALALIEVGDQVGAQKVLTVLLKNVQVEANGDVQLVVSREVSTNSVLRKMSSTVQATANLLQVLSRINPQDGHVDGIVQYLLKKRLGKGWENTHDTAYAVLALTDYLLAVRQEGEVASVTVGLNGQEERQLQIGGISDSASLAIPLSRLKPGINQLRLASTDSEKLYYTVSSRMLVQADTIEAAGLKVTRTYLDPKTKQPLKSFSPGELVLVKLTINLNEAASYLMLEDHLPAGLEALNEALNSTSYEAFSGGNDYYYSNTPYYHWESWGYNKKEIRSDRVTFFVTRMYEGEHTFTYLTRVRFPGQFTALPAEFSAMYSAEIWGRSASELIFVSPP